MPGHRFAVPYLRRTAGLIAAGIAAAPLLIAGLASAADAPAVGQRPNPEPPSAMRKLSPNPAPPPSDNAALELPRNVETDPGAVAALLDALVRMALERNPSLAAARSAFDAAAAHIPIAGSPPDPLFGFRLKDLPTTFSFTRENATEKQIEFAQAYPFPGKLTVKEDIARRDAEVVRTRVFGSRAELVAQVRTTFAELFAADEEISVAFARRRILSELAAIATNKYRLGAGLQQDVLNADVARARIETRLIELVRKRATREIRLANLLDQDAVHVPALGALPPATLSHTPEELEEMALAANPQVEEAARAVSREERGVDLARRSALPDFQFGGDYGSRVDHPPPAPASALTRPDMIGLSVMATVPVFYFTKQRQEVVEAQARLARRRSILAAVRRKTAADLYDLIARYHQHDQVARSFEQDVLPLAHSAVAAAVSAYQLDKVDFLTTLAAEDKLDDYRAEFWENEANRFADLAQIDAMTGVGAAAEGPNR
jgi:cobalt-zinc-cadmium efflux system outer membrane protein